MQITIPFDLGKKSLLAIAGNDVILGVNNHSNNVFLGECNLKNLNTKSFQENFKYCKFYDSDQQYLSEEGMDFLGIEKKNGFYQINYKILENDIPIIKNFIVATSKFKTIEDKGSISLIEDDLNRFRIKEPKKVFII